MKKFLFDCGTRDSTAAFGILALRIMLGLMMLVGHGIGKIQKFDQLKADFPVPSFFPLHYFSSTVSLVACIMAEVGAAALIIFGIATRPAAFVLAFTMVVAAFEVHTSSPWFLGAATTSAKEPALLYIISLIAIILTGAGSFSMDAVIHHENRRRHW